MGARFNIMPGQLVKVGFTPFQLRILEAAYPGNWFWVDSGDPTPGNATERGSFEQPLQTIDYANGLCTADNGDLIIAKPGHVETISAAGSDTFDISGVTALALGNGITRAMFDFTATAGTVNITANNVHLAGFAMRANISAVAVGINVDAHHVELDHLFSFFDATGDDFVITVDIDAFDYAYVHDCWFTTEITAGADSGIRLDDTHFTRIERNTFVGQWAKAAIINEGALCLQCLVKDNIIFNADTSVYNGIDFGTLSSTGMVVGNRVTAMYDTAVAKIFRDGDLTFHDNSWANATNERGATLLPATSSA